MHIVLVYGKMDSALPNAYGGFSGWNIREHNSVCTDTGTVADCYASQQDSTRADVHPVAEPRSPRRMAITRAESHAMIHDTVTTDHRFGMYNHAQASMHQLYARTAANG